MHWQTVSGPGLDNAVRNVHDPYMEKISTTDLRDNLAHWLWHVGHSRETVIIMSYGREVAALVPATEKTTMSPGKGS